MPKHPQKMIRPNQLKALADKLGATDAAEKVGISYASCNKYLNNEECPIPVERSAELALRKSTVNLPALRQEVLFVRVPHDKVELVSTFAKTIGCRVARFRDEQPAG